MASCRSGRTFAEPSVAVLICLVWLTLPGCASSDPDSWIEGRPKHHIQSGFRNYPIIPDFAPVRNGFYFRRVMDSFFLPDVPASHVIPEPQALRELQALNQKDSITWLGHSTFLIRLSGHSILTDPFLTEYATAWEPFGPRRFVAPGINVDKLPPIDIIVVSHNHFDHLDEDTVEALPGKRNIQVFVPLGLGDFFTEKGYANVHELDWQETVAFGAVELTALPVVHTSGRGLKDHNRSLWCGWSIRTPASHLLFSGDSAYSQTLFKKIGEEHGPFDLAMVSIGTYLTRQYGPPSHLTPEQALRVALDTRSRRLVAMHWGTIQLSDEPPWEPPERFRKAARELGIADDDAWLMKIGESRRLPGKGGERHELDDE